AMTAEKASIPVVRGDMPDTWIHGPMCDPAGARLARNLRPLFTVTESLRAHLGAWGVTTQDPTVELTHAREQSLLYGEHTWGGGLYWVTGYGKDLRWAYGDQWKADLAAGRFERLESSWDEHSAYIENARQVVEPVLAREMKILAQSVHASGRRIVVFNPLPWIRDGLVTLRGVNPNGDLKPVDGREILPTWSDEGTLCFIARNVPASGYRTYGFVPGKVHEAKVQTDPNQRTMESPFFKAVLDPTRSVITSLIDKRTGHELVDAAAAQGFGQYLYERFDSNNVAAYVKAYVKIPADWAVAELGKPVLPTADVAPYQAASPSGCTWAFEQSPAAVIASSKAAPCAPLSHAVTTKITLYADLPCVDLEITVHDKPADAWPEAGWLCLPFKLDAPQFRLGRLGGIVDPARDIVAGANHDVEAIHTGVALLDKQGSGVGVCALDSPLMSLERPGCYKYTSDFTPHRSTLFVNLFNNQWSTNFRLWNSGTWTSRVRLWSFRRYHANAGLITPALEAREPLMAAVAEGNPGPLAPTKSGLSVSRKGVAITAFGPNPDGSGLVLRFWEYSGQSGKCRVRFPAGLRIARAIPVDLRGHPTGAAVEIHRHSFTTQLNAFAPASFVLESLPSR
ncbi:MAG TPA: hypothetical protein VEC99_01685, partial [Clostridia bacterium]|nr:hypothetical protein [Clostridia bacterium]